jgi:hypothetical protein
MYAKWNNLYLLFFIIIIIIIIIIITVKGYNMEYVMLFM